MHRRRSSLLLATVATLSACGGGDDPIDDPRYLNARLEIVGSPAVNLQFDETATLQVRYLDQEDQPIEGAPIRWAILGEAADSRLAALQSTTDVDGVATMTLTSGTSNTDFEVEVSPPGDGAPVRFAVSVSDEVVGSISVTMTYGGVRTLVSFQAYLFDGVGCPDLSPDRVSDPLRSAPNEPRIDARPAFAGLPPGIDYAVAVVARNERHVAAFGCADSVVVNAGENTEVVVVLDDVELPLDFAGVWSLDNRFDFGGALPPAAESLVNVLGELADDDVTDGFGDPSFEHSDMDGDGYAPEYGVDPGAFVADLVMRQTCRWECRSGEDYSSCSNLNHRLGDIAAIYEQTFNTWDGAQSRFFGGCGGWEFVHTDLQNLVNTQAEASVPDFVSAWARLTADLANAITNARIRSELTISDPAGSEFTVPIRHELIEMSVPYRPLSGGSEVATFALADAGFMSVPAMETSTVDGATLLIPEHSFDLNFGELAMHIYREVLLPGIFGVASTGELIATWVDCMTVATWLYNEIDALIFPVPVPVTVAELEGYCDDALMSAGAALEAELASRIDAPGTLTIAGSALGTDVDTNTGRVGTLSDGMWMGTFREDATSGEVTGTFEGTRR